jgi:hypothetical protein
MTGPIPPAQPSAIQQATEASHQALTELEQSLAQDPFDIDVAKAKLAAFTSTLKPVVAAIGYKIGGARDDALQAARDADTSLGNLIQLTNQPGYDVDAARALMEPFERRVDALAAAVRHLDELP